MYITPPVFSYASRRTSHIHRRPHDSPLSSSPGLLSVIGMKGNGPERGRKETFLHSYLFTLTVSGAVSHTHTHSEASLCLRTSTHTQTVDLLQDDGRNNIGLIVKHIKGKHILHEASQRMKECSNSNSFVSLREYI